MSGTAGPLYEARLWQELNDGLRRPGGLGLTERAVMIAGLSSSCSLLDIGCGSGVSAGYLTERCGLEVCGLDSSEFLLEQAAADFPECRFICGKAENLPFSDCSFDAVIAECSLSLCLDLSNSLSEVCRVLKPGGAFLLSDMYDRHGDAVHGRDYGGSCFQRLRTEARWRELIETSGFRIIHHEDRSPDLGALTARLIFEFGSLAGFYDEFGIGESVCAAKPGYFLAVMKKEKV